MLIVDRVVDIWVNCSTMIFVMIKAPKKQGMRDSGYCTLTNQFELIIIIVS